MAEPVQLTQIQAFQAALQDYRVSTQAQAVLDAARLVVLSGLTGGGRNTVINHLVKDYNYFFLVSDTTRPPKVRNGALEIDGVHYYFRTETDMLADIQAGEFIEAEIIHNQQVSGTSIRELRRANRAKRIAIHDFEFGGARVIAEAKPNACIIGLLPPSYDEWLRRLGSREEMHATEFVNRLRTAEKVLDQMLGQPYFRYVINDSVSQCAADIDQLASGVVNKTKQNDAKKVAQTIRSNVIETLQSHI